MQSLSKKVVSEKAVLLASGVAAMGLGSVVVVSLPALLAVVMQWREGRSGSGDLDGQFGAAVNQLQTKLDQSPEFGGLDWGIVEAAFEQLGKVDLSSEDIIAAISAGNSKDEAEVVSGYVANKIDWAGHDDRYQRGFKFAFNSAYAQVLATPEFKQDRVYVFARELLANQSKNQLEQSRQHRQVIQLLNELLDRRESLDLDRKYDWSVAGKTDYLAMTFSARGTEFVGREQERLRLRALLDDERKIVWWQIAGKAGQGKSRLALDFVDSLDDGVWHAGFLSWDQLSEVNWKTIDFLRPTLIVIDYVANQQKAQAFVQALRSLKTREHKSLHHKVRFLLLEREGYKLGSDNNGLANWLSPFLKKTDDEQALKQYCFEKQALELPDLSAVDMKAIINSWRRFQKKPALSADELSKIIQQLRGGSTRNRAWRPLFAILFASLDAAGLETETPLSIEDILARVLEEEKANFWEIAGEPLKQAMYLACLATMLGKIDLQKLREIAVDQSLYFDGGQLDEIIRQAHCLLGRALVPDADKPNYTLQAREPDLLGEYFVVRYLGRLLDPIKGNLQNFDSLIQDAWSYELPTGLIAKLPFFPDFLLRLNQNFSNHKVTQKIGAVLPREPTLELIKSWGILAWVVCGLSAVIRQYGVTDQRTKNSILVATATNGNIAIFQLVLELNAPRTSTNNFGEVTKELLLILAAESGHIEIVKILLDQGAAHSQANESVGAFPLLQAAQQGHIDIAKILLERGANPNQTNQTNGTFPLLMAVHNGHLEMVRLLLQAGALPNKIHEKTGAFPLLIATQNGHIPIVKLLLEQEADLKQINEKNGDYALLVAAGCGHTEIIHMLLEAGASSNQINNNNGVFPLLLAVQNNYAEVVSVLLQNGSCANQVNKKDGVFPLLLAAEDGHSVVVRLLLKQNANPNQANKNSGSFPLLVAAQNGYVDVVDLLLERGACPDQVDVRQGAFPLLQAAQQGHTLIAKKLLENGASADQVNTKNGTFPLLQSAQQGHVGVVNLLLEQGADFDRVNRNNGTFPLLLATEQGHVKVASLLLGRGAACDRINKNNGVSPLLRAVEHGHLGILKLLLKKKASLNQIHENTGASPLLLAAQQGHTEIVKVLLEQGAPINQVDKKTGIFPLLLAARGGHTKTSALLLDKKALPDQINDADGSFSLLYAAEYGHTEIVRLLVDHKVCPNQINRKVGVFPILLAAQNGHEEAVRLLLQRGANANQINKKDGVSPLLIATQNGHIKIVKLLLENGASTDQDSEKNGLFPLLMAAQCGRREIASLLLQRGASPNKAHRYKGVFPIDLAVKYGHMEVAKILLLAGAFVTPQIMAKYSEHSKIADLLNKTKSKPPKT